MPFIVIALETFNTSKKMSSEIQDETQAEAERKSFDIDDLNRYFTFVNISIFTSVIAYINIVNDLEPSYTFLVFAIVQLLIGLLFPWYSEPLHKEIVDPVYYICGLIGVVCFFYSETEYLNILKHERTQASMVDEIELRKTEIEKLGNKIWLYQNAELLFDEFKKQLPKVVRDFRHSYYYHFKNRRLDDLLNVKHLSQLPDFVDCTFGELSKGTISYQGKSIPLNECLSQLSYIATLSETDRENKILEYELARKNEPEFTREEFKPSYSASLLPIIWPHAVVVLLSSKIARSNFMAQYVKAV